MTDAERTSSMLGFLRGLLKNTEGCAVVYPVYLERRQVVELAYLLEKYQNLPLKKVKTKYDEYLAHLATLKEHEDFCTLCGEIYPIWMRSTHLFTCWKLEEASNNSLEIGFIKD